MDLPNDCPRNLDYGLAVKTFTAFLFIKIGKLKQALEFIMAAESTLH